MHKSLIAASALLLVSITAFAAPAAPKAKASVKKAPQAISLVCPVTGEKIASIKDAAGSSTYKGKTYYFCCSSCKPAFDKSPAKFIKSASAAPTAKPSEKM